MKRSEPDNNYERLVAEETLIFQAGEAIAELLEAQSITRQALAKRLGKSKGLITHLLSGRRNMTLRTLADLAFALDHRFELVVRPQNENTGGWPGRRRPVVRSLGTEDSRENRRYLAGAASQQRCLHGGVPQVRTHPPAGSSRHPRFEDSIHEGALAG